MERFYNVNPNNIASEGIALGRASFFHKHKLVVPQRIISTEEQSSELQRYKSATTTAKAQIQTLTATSELFSAHIDLLDDFALVDQITTNILEQNQNAELAVNTAIESFIEIFASMDDAYMQERTIDLKDIGDRLLRILQGLPDEVFEPVSGSEVIIVADDLTPSDTANMNLDVVKGFITRFGGVTSHVAILARNMHLAAFVGVGDLIDPIKPDSLIVLDSLEEKLILEPNEAQVESFRQRITSYKDEEQRLLALCGDKTETTDGVEVNVYANAGNIEDIKKAKDACAEGIGLFRTEFLFMESDHFPTEEEQFAVYKEIASNFKGEIIIRTLDIGGDKTLPYFKFEHEDNPFLGWRAIRISLSMEAIFKAQLKAILRAGVFGKLKIMFPMIVSMSELEAAKGVLMECIAELVADGVAFHKEIPVGMMIETPAAVIMADKFAKAVDFFSIGTNDLTQYTLAVDRGNHKISHLYNSLDPAVLRSIAHVVEAAHANGIEVGMCGELAGNKNATEILVGMGLDELSVSPAGIPAIKQRIREISMVEAQKKAALSTK